jgi:PAS domain S-box-containing protein/putative nucleotidyltransferase with HDIG domain
LLTAMSDNHQKPYVEYVFAQDSLFQKIIETISDGFALANEKGIIQTWNPRQEQLTGLPASEAVGQPLWEIQQRLIYKSGDIQPDREELQRVVADLLKSGTPPWPEDTWKAEITHTDGTVRSIELRFFPIKTETGYALAFTTKEIPRSSKPQLNPLESVALQAAANGIAITNHKGEIMWANPAFTELTGYTLQEVQGRTFSVLKSGHQSDNLYKNLWETVTKGEVWRGEMVNRRKDGSLYIEEQIITPVQDENGQVTNFIAIMQDITQRRITEDALRESERRFSEILETIKLTAIMLDMHGSVIYCNRFFLDLTGRKREEVLGKHWFSTFLPEKDREREEERFRTGDIPSHYENEILTRDGERRTIAWNNTFIHDAEGNRISTTSIGEDITERKKAEIEISRLAAVVEQIAEGVAITDLEHNILYVNPFFESLSGYNRQDLLGKNFQELRKNETTQEYMASVWSTLKDGNSWKGTLINTRKDGSVYHEESTFFPVRSQSNEVISFAAVGRDITDRVEAEEQIQLQMRRLAALRSIDLAITSSLDVRVVLNVLLDQVVTQLGVDAAALLLLNPHTQMLEYSGSRGFRKNAIQQSNLRLGQGIPGQVAIERRSISIPNFSQFPDRFVRAPLIAGEDFMAYHAVPLIAKGQVKGVLEIYNRSPMTANTEWLNFLDTLAGQAAIAIDNAALLSDLQRSNEELAQAYVTTLEGWVRTLGLRDDETEEHAQRVTQMTLRLAESMGVHNSELVHIRRGALLHDIGKMAVPDQILLKSGPLDDEEWDIMRRHPVDAFELLAPISYLRPALDIPYCHHEKWDGTGYPRGLRGEEIPLAARMFAVADVWDALLTDRPYRRAWPHEKVIRYLGEQEGKHFDPRVLEAFFAICMNNGYEN